MAPATSDALVFFGATGDLALLAVFPEAAVFRIDHYLGKEPVQNLLTSASRTRSWSRSGTATTWTACRSPWRRASESRGAEASTTRRAPSGTSSRTTSCR